MSFLYRMFRPGRFSWLVLFLLIGCGGGAAQPATRPPVTGESGLHPTEDPHPPTTIAHPTATAAPAAAPPTPEPPLTASPAPGTGTAPPPQLAAVEPLSGGDLVAITTDAGIRHQRMAGFGVTHNAYVYENRGDILPPLLRQEAIEFVYGQVGINLGNLEMSLLESPGSYGERDNDNDDPFQIDWGGFQTLRSDAIKEAIVDPAEPLGFTDYFLAQKVNVRWDSPWLANLRAVDYERFLDEIGEQAAAALIYWRETYGYDPQLLMLFNEPLSGNRELDGGSAREITDIIKRVGRRLRDEGFAGVKFIVPSEETVELTLNTASTILSDPEARQYVGVLGYHPYPYHSPYANLLNILNQAGQGTPNEAAVAQRGRLRDLAAQYEIPLWMTEVSHGNLDPLTFDSLRGRAIHIHDELVYADAAAYFGMLNMWDLVSQREHFGNDSLLATEGHIALIDQEQGLVYPTGMGYAIGHYARWVRPGAVRIEAASGDPLVLVSAFFHEDAGQIVWVLVNNADSPRRLEIDLNGLEISGQISGEWSTAEAPWQPLTPFVPVDGGRLVLTVPPLSVISLSAPTR